MKVDYNNLWHSVDGLDAVDCEVCVAVLSCEKNETCSDAWFGDLMGTDVL